MARLRWAVALALIAAIPGLLLAPWPRWLPQAPIAPQQHAAHGHEGPAHPGLTTFVHLSDVHLNIHTHADIPADLLSLAAELGAPGSLRPAKVVISGDLVDSKTAAKASKQFEEEWAAYGQLWRRLAALSGVGEQGLLGEYLAAARRLTAGLQL